MRTPCFGGALVLFLITTACGGGGDDAPEATTAGGHAGVAGHEGHFGHAGASSNEDGAAGKGGDTGLPTNEGAAGSAGAAGHAGAPILAGAGAAGDAGAGGSTGALYAASCGAMSGLQAGSPWPMRARGPSHACPSNVVGAQHPTLRWTIQIPFPVHISSPVIAADGTVYLTSGPRGADEVKPGAVFAFEGATGKIKWSFTTKGESNSSVAIGADGALYFGTRTGFFYAISDEGSAAKQRWSRSIGTEMESAPTLGADGTIFIGFDDKSANAVGGGAIALSPAGQTLWSMPLGGYVVASPALDAKGHVYAAVGFPEGKDARVVALDAAKGNVVDSGPDWGEAIPAPMIGPDGTVYAVKGQTLVASSADLKTIFWTAVQRGSGSPSIAPDGSLRYVDAGQIVALSPKGEPLWVSVFDQTNTFAEHSTPAVDAEGNAYVGSYRIGAEGTPAMLYAVSATGKKLWSLPTMDQVSSSPAIGADGTIYVADLGGNVYAIGP